jgi:hypothetical protein
VNDCIPKLLISTSPYQWNYLEDADPLSVCKAVMVNGKVCDEVLSGEDGLELRVVVAQRASAT